MDVLHARAWAELADRHWGKTVWAAGVGLMSVVGSPGCKMARRAGTRLICRHRVRSEVGSRLNDLASGAALIVGQLPCSSQPGAARLPS
jgi:hypothetical protein